MYSNWETTNPSTRQRSFLTVSSHQPSILSPSFLKSTCPRSFLYNPSALYVVYIHSYHFSSVQSLSQKMYPSPALQQDNTRIARPHDDHIDLRDRIKPYLKLGDDATLQNPRETEVSSPTDAFFGRPSRLAIQTNNRQAPVTRALNRPQVQQELKASEKRQRERLSLSGIATSGSPLAQELIGEFVFDHLLHLVDQTSSKSIQNTSSPKAMPFTTMPSAAWITYMKP